MQGIRVEHIAQEAYNPWQELAIAVIKQTAADYRFLGKKLQESGSAVERKHMAEKMKEISRFFLGEDYSTLSGLDNGGNKLERLDQEVFGEDD